MNIYRNEKLIQRNGRIAQIGLIVTLAVLVGGMLLAFQQPEQILLSYGILIVGFILFQITVYFQNRWGRKPRPDMLLDQALKGLDKRHALYHYLAPVNHLLVGPSGIWVLLPFYQRGTIRFENGRYKQSGRSLYWKIFGQEGLGRPELEVEANKASLEKFLKERFPDQEFPRVEAVLVFTDPRAVVDISPEAEPPAATVPLKELKEVIRKGGKSKSIAMEKIKLLEDELPKE